MTESAKLIQFPPSKIVRTNFDHDQLEKMKERGLQNYADMLVSEITDVVLTELDNCGIEIETDQFSRDMFLATGIITATVYRALGLEHPYQKLVDETVKVVEKT